MTASSRDRSSRETVKDIPVRISMTRTEKARTESQFGLLRPAQSTRFVDAFFLNLEAMMGKANFRGDSKRDAVAQITERGYLRPRDSEKSRKSEFIFTFHCTSDLNIPVHWYK